MPDIPETSPGTSPVIQVAAAGYCSSPPGEMEGSFQAGGPVQRFATGGFIPHRNNSCDELLAILTDDCVLSRRDVERLGGPTVRELARAQAAAAQNSPPPDILAMIDEAVQAVLQPVQPCGCGCGKPVDPAGPNLYFARQSCQNDWQNRQVTDPHEVYGRDDAAQVRHSSAAVSGIGPDPVTGGSIRHELPGCADPHGAAYRRLCPGCGETVIPAMFEDEDGDGEIRTFGDSEPVRTYASRMSACCPHCGTPLPGPALAASVSEEPAALVFELHDGRARARQRMPLHEVLRQGDPKPLFRWIWQTLERQLHRFSTWRGRRDV